MCPTLHGRSSLPEVLGEIIVWTTYLARCWHGIKRQAYEGKHCIHTQSIIFPFQKFSVMELLG